MPRLLLLLALACAVLLAPATAMRAAEPADFAVPADLDAAPLDRLLRKHVDARGLVAYAAWRASAEDVAELEAWLARLAEKPAAPAPTGSPAWTAGLINAYNAFTIRLILERPDVSSIRDIPDAWKNARWPLAGRRVSLDAIEHEGLRPVYGWRVHAVVVCAAVSCPPLQAEAYTADNLESLAARAWRAWLGREDLNNYDPPARRLALSPIFQWYAGDFVGDGALQKVLIAYGPEKHREFFERGRFSIVYRDYDWALNAQPAR